MKPRKTKELDAILKKKGFITYKRDHTFYILCDGNRKTSIFTKLSHGMKEYSKDLLAQMARQLSLSNKEFEQLLNCPINHDKLIKLLKEKNKIN
ncbi:MAG: hypothetical protein H5U05_06655 [Candidatus Aminicenantes bacterium]|nr:hypothetical protein [Candidatus Aminicenantes bacterium]